MSKVEIEKKYTSQITKSLENQFSDILLAPDGYMKCSASDVEQMMDKFNKVVDEVSSKLPKSKFKKGLKPYWNEDLKTFYKQEKDLWRKWKSEGGVKEGSLYELYKEKKRLFRAAIRTAERNYEIKQMEEITNMEQIEQTYFWHLVNKARNRSKSCINPIEDNGQLLTDPGAICEAWKGYFQKLYSPEDKPHYDNEFKQYIEDQVKRFHVESKRQNTEILKEPISELETATVIKSLKSKKAPGVDNITAEHIKFGGECMTKCMTYIFNVITWLETQPQQMKLGMIIPIPKRNKDATQKDNNRGITLLPIISKVYEKVLILRDEKTNRKKKIDHLQGANVKKCSSIHTTWMLRETMSQFRIT